MKFRFTIPIARWDEGIPIGNGLIGALVWGNAREIVLSLDQATLWDERCPASYKDRSWNFEGLLQLIHRKRWKAIQDQYESTENTPWPTKVRACRMVLAVGPDDAWTHAELDISRGLISVFSRQGRVFITCDAARPLLAVRSEGVSLRHRIEFPDYRRRLGERPAPDCLRALDYPAAAHGLRGDVKFCVQRLSGSDATVTATRAKQSARGSEVYIYVSDPGEVPAKIEEAVAAVRSCATRGFRAIKRESSAWWKEFWTKSRVQISHRRINRHYQLGQYFLGSCSRAGAPSMPLQGIWTADDGKLPPWRGDYHHNLNTQFCYISYLANNRLEEGLAFLEHMWRVLPKHREWAARFFNAPGAFIPLCTSLNGEMIRAWAPYAFNLTNGSWVADMFYRHWKHTLDLGFLRERAYPYCLAQAEFLLHLLKPDPTTGRLLLPISSSAEIYDNTPRAYLPANSNYDHFLMVKLFQNLEEMSLALGRKRESIVWKRHRKALGSPALVPGVAPDGLIDGEVLGIAPGMPLDRSHRHHAHLMGIYPLNFLHPMNGPKEEELIAGSLRQIDLLGTGEWVGYSFSWYAALCARIGRGEAAVSMLERYLDGFVSSNGFHLNGDFKNLGYSVYKYRPFTLEGNFAAVQAVNEMLVQSINGVIHVGYSLPTGITASFERLRTEGGFLISAKIDSTRTPTHVAIQSTVGGLCRMANPWPGEKVVVVSDAAPERGRKVAMQKGVLLLHLPKGATCQLVRESLKKKP